MQKGSLTVVGTGYQVAAQMTPEAVEHCRKADKLFYVVDSVTAVWLAQLNPSAESLAVYYAPGKPRFVTYGEMVKRILDEATEQVRAVLSDRRVALEAIARRLIDKEVMDGAELRQLLESTSPGPRLVPGSEALPGAVDVAPAGSAAACVPEQA